MTRKIALLFMMFALAGCGNKGPLVMASPAPAAPPIPAEAPVAEPSSSEAPTPTDPVPGSSGTPTR